MALLAGFVELSDALMRAKAQSGQTLPMGPAMPFWLDGIQLEWKGSRKPVSRHLQDIYDYVALMDYRDHAEGGDGLVSHAMDALSYGAAIGRPVLIGIETSPNEIKKVSFHHLGEADLERELAATTRSVGRMRSFGGYVVHHYARLPPLARPGLNQRPHFGISTASPITLIMPWPGPRRRRRCWPRGPTRPEPGCCAPRSS
jgi:hypothetical protein